MRWRQNRMVSFASGMANSDSETQIEHIQKIPKMHLSYPNIINTIHFRDGLRKIDFIFVTFSEILQIKEKEDIINKCINHLRDVGLEFEYEQGIVHEELTFIKVHAPQNVLLHFAEVYRIELSMHKKTLFQKNVQPIFSFMATKLIQTNPDENQSEERPGDLTSAERIVIVNQLLSSLKFVHDGNNFELSKLINQNFFVAAYPLHDSTWIWPDDEHASDRQLLAKYWANVNVWYKQQPLDLIQKYYGTEVAFYFAWLGLYNKMLIYATVVGCLCFLYGLISLNTFGNLRTKEICESNIMMCPSCLYHSYCNYTPLKDACLLAKVTYLFDNTTTIFFSIFMAFWSTLFMKLWTREQALLTLRWNLLSKKTEVSLRREFIENTKQKRVSNITGKEQPYEPTRIKIFHYSVTFITCTFMIVIVLAATFSVIMYRLFISALFQMDRYKAIKKRLPLIIMVTGSIINVIFIKIFGKFYGKVSLWLTNLENPRTQQDFDNSYIYKLCVLSFVNNYSAMAYIAFVKGKLFTYPGNEDQSNFFYGIFLDLCHPSGCLIGVCIQLAFIMLLKSLVGNLLTLFEPTIKKLWKQFFKHEKSATILPQWEEEYNMTPTQRYFLVREYIEMILQYGLVTFFVAAFPLAPLCALINNLVELRIDSNKLVRRYRRPIPNNTTGMEAWNGILQMVTYLAIITNAFVLAFTSDFVTRELYKHQVDPTLKGYVNSTLSMFDTKDLKSSILKRLDKNVSICFYRGNRYPPNHSLKYEITSAYWMQLAVKFIVILLFEHLLMALTNILAYAIPDLPYSLRERLQYDEMCKKNVKNQILHKTYKEEQEKMKTHYLSQLYTR